MFETYNVYAYIHNTYVFSCIMYVTYSQYI